MRGRRLQVWLSPFLKVNRESAFAEFEPKKRPKSSERRIVAQICK